MGETPPRQRTPAAAKLTRRRKAARSRRGARRVWEQSSERRDHSAAQHSTLSAAGTPRAPLAVKQTPSQQFPPRGAYPHAAAEGLPGRTKRSWRAPEQLGAGTGSALPSSTRAAARSPGDRDACGSRAESSGPGSRPPPRNGAGTAGTPRRTIRRNGCGAPRPTAPIDGRPLRGLAEGRPAAPRPFPFPSIYVAEGNRAHPAARCRLEEPAVNHALFVASSPPSGLEGGASTILSLHWPFGTVNHPAATAAPRALSRPVGAFPSFPSASLRLPELRSRSRAVAERREAAWRRRRGGPPAAVEGGEGACGSERPESGGWEQPPRAARRGVVRPMTAGSALRRPRRERGRRQRAEPGGRRVRPWGGERPPARSPESLASARPAGQSCRRVCLFVFPFPPPFRSPPPPLEPARRGEEIAREAGTREPGAARIQEAREHGARPLGRPPQSRAVRGGSKLFFFYFFPLSFIFIFFSFLPNPIFCPPASPSALIYASGERRPPAPPHRPAMSAAISAAEKVDGFTRKSVRKAQRQKRSQGSSQFRSQSSQVELSPLPQLKGTAVPPRPCSRTGALGPFPRAFPRVLLAHGLALALRARAPVNKRPAGRLPPAVPGSAPLPRSPSLGHLGASVGGAGAPGEVPLHKTRAVSWV